MAKPVIQVQAAYPAANTPPFPIIDRSTVANLPPANTVAVNSLALVTDGTFAPSAGQGSAPVGGGSLLNLVWSNGTQWLTV